MAARIPLGALLTAALLLAAPVRATAWRAPLEEYLGVPVPAAASASASVRAWLSTAAASYVFEPAVSPARRDGALRAVAEAVALRALQSAGLAGDDERAALEARVPEAAGPVVELIRFEDKEYPRPGEEGPFPLFDMLVRRIPGLEGRPDWSAARGVYVGPVPAVNEPGRDLALGQVLDRAGDARNLDWVASFAPVRTPPDLPADTQGAEARALVDVARLWALGGRADAEAACRSRARLEPGLYEPWLLEERGVWYRTRFLPQLCAADHGRCARHISARVEGREVDPTGDGKGCDEAPYYLWLAAESRGRSGGESCAAFIQKIFEERGFLGADAVRRSCAGLNAAVRGSADLGFCTELARAGRPAAASADAPADSADALCRGLAAAARGPAACAPLDGPWRRICLVGALTWAAATAGDASLCRDSSSCLAAVGDARACGPAAREHARVGVCRAFVDAFAPRLEAAFSAAFERASAAAGPEGRAWLERLSARP